MITTEMLLELLSLASEYWSTGEKSVLHEMCNLLAGIDEYDAIYEIAHICARRKMTIGTYVSVLKTLGFEIGGNK